MVKHMYLQIFGSYGETYVFTNT